MKRLYPQNFLDHRLTHFVSTGHKDQLSVFGIAFGLCHDIKRLSVKDIAL